MRRWLFVAILASAAGLAAEEDRSTSPVLDPSRAKALENALRYFDPLKLREKISRPQSLAAPERCGHILVMPADPSIDPNITVPLPKENEPGSFSSRMPKLEALPPCSPERR